MKYSSIFLAVLLSSLVVRAEDEPTAFDLMKEANRYVGEQSKDKIVQLRSEKSVGSLTPKVWFVVFYDATATFKATEVKFAAGKMIDVKRPFRVLERITDADKLLDKDKLKIDSDKAIETALKEKILENITIKAVQLRLENRDAGPVWEVKLWASKLNKPSQTVDIGEIVLTADDGKVIETDVDISKVD